MPSLRRFLPLVIALAVGVAVLSFTPHADAATILQSLQSLTMEQAIQKIASFLEIARMIIAGVTGIAGAGSAAWYTLRKDVIAQRAQLDDHGAKLDPLAAAPAAPVDIPAAAAPP